MLKPLIYSVECEQFGKLVSLKNCLKCEFYLGKKNYFVECTFDKEKHKDNIISKYKDFYKNIEFGEEE